MRNWPRLMLGAALALNLHASAQDDEPAPPPKKPGVRITFLPPPLDGTLSLGVYDKAGKLVRTLSREATTKDFVIGLNGLIAWWDGKDDAGAPVPVGNYAVRGYGVGALDFQGEAFHFNDWVGDDGTPRVQRVTDLRAEADGLCVIAAEPAGTFVRMVAGTDGATRETHAMGKVDRFPHPMNAESPDEKWTAIREAAEKAAGGPVTALAGEDVVLGLRDGRLLLREKEEWRSLDLPTLQHAIHACLGRDATFWVIDRTSAGVEVKQYTFAGEFQRRLAVAAEDPAPLRIAAEAKSDTIALLEESPGLQRVRMLRLADAEPAPDAGPSSTWKVIFSKTIRFNEDLATVRGEMKSGVAFSGEEKITVRLLPNPLVRNATTSVDVNVGVDAKGSFLRTADGLSLKRITETSGLRWVAMMREPGSKAVTIFQSDGAVVEEFKARKLANMMAFDAGDYEWSGKP